MDVETSPRRRSFYQVIGRTTENSGGLSMNACCHLEKNQDHRWIEVHSLVHVICIKCGKEWIEWISLQSPLSGVTGAATLTVGVGDEVSSRTEELRQLFWTVVARRYDLWGVCVLFTFGMGEIRMTCKVCLDVFELYGSTESVAPWLCECPESITRELPGSVQLNIQGCTCKVRKSNYSRNSVIYCKCD